MSLFSVLYALYFQFYMSLLSVSDPYFQFLFIHLFLFLLLFIIYVHVIIFSFKHFYKSIKFFIQYINTHVKNILWENKRKPKSFPGKSFRLLFYWNHTAWSNNICNALLTICLLENINQSNYSIRGITVPLLVISLTKQIMQIKHNSISIAMA